MHRFLSTLLAVVFAAALPLLAQDNPLSDEARQSWNRTRGNLMAAAERMPADKYSFKPSPESQSFGTLVAHTASSAVRSCSGLIGDRRQVSLDGERPV
jgi:hypothetical protein